MTELQKMPESGERDGKSSSHPMTDDERDG